MGDYSHQLTVDEMPSHSHKLGDAGGTTGTGVTPDLNHHLPSTMNVTPAIGDTGGDKRHPILSPVIITMMWMRTT